MLSRVGGRVATEPNIGRPGAGLNLFDQDATVTDPEKDPISWDLEPPADWVVSNRDDVQRG